MHSQLPRYACALVLLSVLAAAPCRAGEHDDATEKPRRPTIGVAFSGGGAKGCAHIGVLQVFEEMGIPVDYVGGTSMGAIVGGLYAAGYSADDLADLIRSIDWAEAMRDRPPRSDLSFRRKQESLRYPIDLVLGLRDGEVQWP